MDKTPKASFLYGYIFDITAGYAVAIWIYTLVAAQSFIVLSSFVAFLSSFL
jgi:hypothetical protein